MDEMCHDVPLQVIDFDEGNAKTERQAFGERRADEQAAEQSGTSGESYGGEFGFVHPCTPQGSIDYGYDVLLMCAAGEFGYYASELLVHGLRGGDVA